MTKHDLLEDFIEHLDNNNLYQLCIECADDGEIEYIETVDSIDDYFTASRMAEFDLDEFSVYDNYFTGDETRLVSYEYCLDALDDIDGREDLIDWIISNGYDGYVDDLTELLDSEEYKEAE